jgi:type IV pilus assembly protein PilM
MRKFWMGKRAGPIGMDPGSRSIKLVQISGDGTHLVEAARWEQADEPALAATSEAPAQASADATSEAAGGDAAVDRLAAALRQAREGRRFRGCEVAVCLGRDELFVQNIRVNRQPNSDFDKLVYDEVSGRMPFPADEAELRYLDAGDVRQGDIVRREVLVFACHRPRLEKLLASIEAAGLRPIAVEVEPLALLRCYYTQFRREEDRNQRVALVHVGHAKTCVVIAQGPAAVFVKYIDLGGKHFDEALARHSQMELAEAWALRRQNGDRRADQQDAEVTRSIAEATRPILDKLAHEISLCLRYHSVTFRGQAIKRLILGGGEATSTLVEMLETRLEVPCELGDPWRSFGSAAVSGRKSQWDVAVGLALRNLKTVGQPEAPAAC